MELLAWQDARAAAQGGADAIGLVFYPPSPRYLSIERAVELRDALPPFVQTVALFVNPDAPQVAQVCERVRPALLQFHGDETPEFCGQFGVPFVKAYRVRSGLEGHKRSQQRGQKPPGCDVLEYLRPFSAPQRGCSTAMSRVRRCRRRLRFESSCRS